MSKYYRHVAESDFGEGFVYFEIKDEWPIRQVGVYGNQYIWADEKHSQHLADQPFSELCLGPEHEISETEFKTIWYKAMKNAGNLYKR